MKKLILCLCLLGIASPSMAIDFDGVWDDISDIRRCEKKVEERDNQIKEQKRHIRKITRKLRRSERQVDELNREIEEKDAIIRDLRRGEGVVMHICSSEAYYDGPYVGRARTKTEAEAKSMGDCRRTSENKHWCKIISCEKYTEGS